MKKESICQKLLYKHKENEINFIVLCYDSKLLLSIELSLWDLCKALVIAEISR